MLLVKGVVLDVVAQSAFFKILVVLLAAVTGIGYDVGRIATQLFFYMLQVRNKTCRIGRALMDTETDDKLILGTDLHIVSGLKLPVAHVIFLHPHEGSVRIRLGITVAPGQLSFLFFVALQSRQVFLFEHTRCFLQLLSFLRLLVQSVADLFYSGFQRLGINRCGGFRFLKITISVRFVLSFVDTIDLLEQLFDLL